MKTPARGECEPHKITLPCYYCTKRHLRLGSENKTTPKSEAKGECGTCEGKGRVLTAPYSGDSDIHPVFPVSLENWAKLEKDNSPWDIRTIPCPDCHGGHSVAGWKERTDDAIKEIENKNNGWEEDFDLEVDFLRYADANDEIPVFFGYRHVCHKDGIGVQICTATDWGHVKSFIANAIRASRLELAGKMLGYVPLRCPIHDDEDCENCPSYYSVRDSLRSALRDEGLVDKVKLNIECSECRKPYHGDTCCVCLKTIEEETRMTCGCVPPHGVYHVLCDPHTTSRKP